MIFDLAQDFHEALAAMPREHPRHYMLELLEEAVRRDIHFIDRHPTTLFQCMWNTCWWYDCPEAAMHYEEPEGGWRTGEYAPAWCRDDPKLYQLVEDWRLSREKRSTFSWLRAHRPPSLPLAAGQVAVMRGHKSAVAEVGFTHSGRRIMSRSSDGLVCIWDDQNSALVVEALGAVGRVCLPEGDDWVLVRRDRERAIVCTIATGEPIAEVPAEHERPLLFSVNRDVYATASDDAVLLFSVSTGDLLQKLPVGHLWYDHFEPMIRGLRFSGDGTWIASCGHNNVNVWSVSTGRRIAELNPHGSSPSHFDRYGVTSIAFFPDAHRIAIAMESGSVLIWDIDKAIQTGRSSLVGCDDASIHRLYTHEGYITHIEVSGDSKLVVSGSADCTVHVWDVVSERVRAVFKGHDGVVTSVAVSPDNRLIASGSEDGTVRLWNARVTGEPLVLTGHLRAVSSARPGAILGLTYSSDGQLLASSGQDGSIRLWSPREGTSLTCLVRRYSETSAHFLSEDTRLLTKSHTYWQSYDATRCSYSMQLWDLSSGGTLVDVEGPEMDKDVYWQASPDGRRLATWSQGPYERHGDQHPARLWDTGRGKMIAVLANQDSDVDGCFFSGDSKRIVTFGVDFSAHVWGAEDGSLLKVLGNVGYKNHIACSSDCILMASAFQGKIRLWNTESRTLQWERDTPIEPWLGDLTFTMHDTLLVGSSRSDGCVWVWEAQSGAEVISMRGLRRPMFSVGEGFFLAADESGVRVWDLRTRQELAILTGNYGAILHEEPLISTWSRDWQWIWNAETVECLCALRIGDEIQKIVSDPFIQKYRWRRSSLETVIEDIKGAFACCYFPAKLSPIVQSPLQVQWACAVDSNDLQIVTLEGNT